MAISTVQVLQSANRPVPVAQVKRTALFVGATGVLGNAVLQRLVGAQRFEHSTVLAQEPLQQGLRTLDSLVVTGDVSSWPLPQRSDVALVMFEPARMFYQRERALYTPKPEELPQLAPWLLACGVRTLVVVLPHVQGSLPEALKAGLASLEEQSVASLGFDRVIFLRSAQKPPTTQRKHPLEALAQWMLSIFKFMVPQTEQPVRAAKIALLVDALLQLAPLGCTVLAPEQVWRFAQVADAQLHEAVKSWLDTDKLV
jgi:hypothetical protein